MSSDIEKQLFEKKVSLLRLEKSMIMDKYNLKIETEKEIKKLEELLSQEKILNNDC